MSVIVLSLPRSLVGRARYDAAASVLAGRRSVGQIIAKRSLKQESVNTKKRRIFFATNPSTSPPPKQDAKDLCPIIPNSEIECC
jgi:hypothetical protein